MIEFTYVSGIPPAVPCFSSAGSAFVGSGLAAGGSGVTALSEGGGGGGGGGGVLRQEAESTEGVVE